MLRSSFRFSAEQIGSHMRHIEVSQVAGLKRHRHLVHACCWTFLGTRDSGRNDTGCGCSGKSATGERHIEPPLICEIGGGVTEIRGLFS